MEDDWMWNIAEPGAGATFLLAWVALNLVAIVVIAIRRPSLAVDSQPLLVSCSGCALLFFGGCGAVFVSWSLVGPAFVLPLVPLGLLVLTRPRSADPPAGRPEE